MTGSASPVVIIPIRFSLKLLHSIIAPLLPILFWALACRCAPAAEVVFEDFEKGRDIPWRSTGDAFAQGPAAGTLHGQQPVRGFHGRRLANSFTSGDAAQGTLTSRKFVIRFRYVKLLVGGGYAPGKCEVRLLVGKSVCRAATGQKVGSRVG